jgi:hypothetical protein
LREEENRQPNGQGEVNQLDGPGPNLDAAPAQPAPNALHTLPQVPARTGRTNRQPVNFTYTESKEFHTDLLHLFVANGFALHAINSVQTGLFFDKYLPGAELPTRQALGGPILRSAVQESREHMVKAVAGRMAVGISDGWKNISKHQLLAYMINVDYTVFYSVLLVSKYQLKALASGIHSRGQRHFRSTEDSQQSSRHCKSGHCVLRGGVGD